MPIHPTPPDDLQELIDGYRQVVQAVINLGYGMHAEDFERDTPCPGWSVRDIFAHIAAVESFLNGAEHPDMELPERGHVRHEFGKWMEQGVQARRSTPGPEIVSELELLLHNRMSTLANPELTLETPVRAPRDTTVPLGELLRLRLFDIWTHEQDLREVFDRPGDLDTTGAVVVMDTLDQAFPVLVAKRLQLAEGESVILDCTGPVTARIGVRMSHDQGGKPWAHALFSGETESPEDEDSVPDGPSTTIILSTDALTRRAAGRRSTADTAYRVVGDEDLAAEVLDSLVITP